MNPPLDWGLVMELHDELDECDSRPKKCARIVDASISTPMFWLMLQSISRNEDVQGDDPTSSINDDMPLLHLDCC